MKYKSQFKNNNKKCYGPPTIIIIIITMIIVFWKSVHVCRLLGWHAIIYTLYFKFLFTFFFHKI